jgi:hypothetical protein
MSSGIVRLWSFALCPFDGRVIAVNKGGEGEPSNTVMAVL